MAIEIRPCQTPEEVAQYDALGAYVFATPETAVPETPTAADWTLCAFDNGQVVSQVGAFPFTVRLNGNPVRMAGVTMVGTYPAYRRQGLLRKLMTQAFVDQRARGQSLAILWASMGAIYQRFGYGSVSSSVTYTFDPRFAQLQEQVESPGTVSLSTAEDAYGIIKQLYIEYASPRNLHIHRSRALWQLDVLKAEKGQPVFAGVYRNADGVPRGHVVYTTKSEMGTPGGGQRLDVKDFIALDLEAHRALWEYICKHDLAGKVVIEQVFGEDDFSPELLLEPRILNRKTSDAIWMRVVDVEQALVQRPYGTRGELTFAIDDPTCPWNTGTYLLETDGPTADIRRTDRTPEMVVTPNALATLLAGHRTATHLGRIGRLSVTSDEVAKRADALFRTEYLPNCPNHF